MTGSTGCDKKCSFMGIIIIIIIIIFGKKEIRNPTTISVDKYIEKFAAACPDISCRVSRAYFQSFIKTDALAKKNVQTNLTYQN